MKKLALILILSVLTLTSCYKDDCTCPPPSTVAIKTSYVDVYPGDWVPENTYVRATFKIPAITNNVLDRGAVLCYFIDENQRDNILPYVFPEQDGGQIYMKNIRYDVDYNEVTFIIEYSDFAQLSPSYTMKFKVVVMQP